MFSNFASLSHSLRQRSDMHASLSHSLASLSHSLASASLSNSLLSDMFKCSKCKHRKTTFYQKQTRSADEPMTVLSLSLPLSLIHFAYFHST